MSRTGRTLLCMGALSLLFSSADVRAEFGLAESGAIWIAHPLLFPVDPDSLSPEMPHTDSRATAVRGPVEVAPDRAAAFWLDALHVVRVRLEDPRLTPTLRFNRVIGSSTPGAARVLVEEHGVLVEPGIFYLIQPAGVGGIWSVSAAKRARVYIEHVELPSGHVAWESLQRSVLDWIDSDAADIELPPFPGAVEMRLRLQAERDIARALVLMSGDAPHVRRATQLWRKASAVQQLILIRPFNRSYLRLARLEDNLADIGPPVIIGVGAPYRRLDSFERSWRIDLEGPGVLRIDARALLNDTRLHDPVSPLRLRVMAGDRSLGETSSLPTPVRWAQKNETGNSDEDADESDERTLQVSDDEEVIPNRVEYTISTGERVSGLSRLSIPLRPGRITYTIEVSGGPMALRVTRGQRRPFAREVLTDSAHEGDFVERARRELGADAGLAATLVRHFLAEIDGASVDVGVLDEYSECDGLAPIPCTLVQISRWQPGMDADALAASVDRATAALADAPWESGWYLRILMASYLSNDGRITQLRRLLATAKRSPPSSVMATLAELLPPPMTDERARSRPVALMDLAWRAAPLDADIRKRYRQLWRERSRWSRLTPVGDDDRKLRDDARIWLRRDDGALGRRGSWGQMPLGRTVTVQAPRAELDPTRPAIMRFAVASTDEQPGPVTVRIDGHEWSALPMRRMERWEFAVAPGDHEVTVDAPESTRVYCSLPAGPAGGYVGAAWVERAWPLEIGNRPVRYDLPAPHVQGPIQVRLRAVLSEDRPRVGTIEMVIDGGRTVRILLDWRRVDREVSIMGDTSFLSETVSFVISPPLGARHVWFKSNSDMPVLASVFVRRPIDEAVQTARSQASAKPSTPLLEQLADLSEQLGDRKLEVDRLIQRAHLLLDLGFPDLARRDTRRAAAGARDTNRPATRRAYRALLARLDLIREPAHLPASSPVGPASEPAPLVPADLALPGRPTPEVIAAAARFRQNPVLASVLDLQQPTFARDPRARYLHARMLDRLGNLYDAGRELVHLSQDIDAWQLMHEATIFLGTVLEQGDLPVGAAAMTYGVARDLDERGTLPAVRKVLLAASELTRWAVIRSADHTAGYQRLMVEVDPDEMNPRTQVTDAMVAVPWRRETPSQFFRPGRSAALQVKLLEATTLRTDIWCRQVKMPPPGERPACRVTVLVDGQPRANQLDQLSYNDRIIPEGRVVRFSTAKLEPGMHRIEVMLARESRLHRAAVRFSSDRQLPDSARLVSSDGQGVYPFRIRKPATGFMAGPEPGRHVQLTVNGPTALHITSRSSNEAPSSQLDISVEGVSSGVHHRRTVRLDTTHDPDAALREGGRRIRELTVATSTVLPIPDAGVHRITIAPDVGLSYIRVSLREDRANAKLTDARPRDLEGRPDNELIRWPGAAPELAVLEATARPRARTEGTFSLNSTLQRNELEDNDTLPQVTKLDITATWRKQIIENRMWVSLTALGRRHLDGRYIFGARARLQDTHLPGGMRGFGELRIFTQMIRSRLEWSAFGRFDINRPTRLSSDLMLIPELSLRIGEMSIDFDRIPSPGPEIDPDVYNVYSFFHRHANIPRLSLRWQPFQDHIGSLQLSAVPNADLLSLDRIELTARWSTLFHITRRRTAIAQLSYRPSYRFYDEDRFEGYARHDVRAAAETSLWTGRTGRLRLHAQATLYLSRLYGPSATFAVGLAYDLTNGRGLRDFFSFEEEFDPYVEGRIWTYDESR